MNAKHERESPRSDTNYCISFKHIMISFKFCEECKHFSPNTPSLFTYFSYNCRRKLHYTLSSLDMFPYLRNINVIKLGLSDHLEIVCTILLHLWSTLSGDKTTI